MDILTGKVKQPKKKLYRRKEYTIDKLSVEYKNMNNKQQ